jgi:hypothetical protein
LLRGAWLVPPFRTLQVRLATFRNRLYRNRPCSSRARRQVHSLSRTDRHNSRFHNLRNWKFHSPKFHSLRSRQTHNIPPKDSRRSRSTSCHSTNCHSRGCRKNTRATTSSCRTRRSTSLANSWCCKNPNRRGRSRRRSCTRRNTRRPTRAIARARWKEHSTKTPVPQCQGSQVGRSSGSWRFLVLVSQAFRCNPAESALSIS